MAHISKITVPCIFQHLSTSGDATTRVITTKDIQVQLEKEIGSLKNESAEGSFNVPTLEPCKYSHCGSVVTT